MYNVNPPFPDVRNFTVSVEYTIDGKDLVVRIPQDSIEYPDKVFDLNADREVSYPLTAISVLPYFGAADRDAEGYIFVPDGSGALINFNTPKASAEPYNGPVYGQDYAALPLAEYSPMRKEQIYLPVYGMKNGNQAFLAVIEEGDAMGRIEATVSGMRDSYNKVWATADVRPNARVNLQAEGDLIHLRRLSIYMYQARFSTSDFVVRYSFLSGDDADYAGMARHYQSYLVDQHKMTKLEPNGAMPLMLEVFGSFDSVKPVLGIPKNVVDPLTTYEQTGIIVQDFLNMGIEDMKIRFMGWLDGGINHLFPNKVRLEKVVGDTTSLTELNNYLQEKRIEFYPSVDFQMIRRNSPIDGFVGFRHSSRSLDRRGAYINTYNIATYQAVKSKRIPILSPAKLDGVVQSFLDEYQALGIKGLALGDLGKLLYSDFQTNANNVDQYLFRLDSSGMGHYIRCISYAQLH